jgi:glucosamine--fructose-6-phosphate aminotransferase (isomerizing)
MHLVSLNTDHSPQQTRAGHRHGTARCAVRKTISNNMQEVMARGKVLLITDKQGAKEAGPGVWDTILMPEVAPSSPRSLVQPSPIVGLSYGGCQRHRRGSAAHLAKPVTVE